MKNIDATELAYKRGYEQGKKDAVKFISVKERLPEDDLPRDSKRRTLHVLVAIKMDDGAYIVRSMTRSKHPYYHPNTFEWSKFTSGTITHWMALPEAPKGE